VHEWREWQADNGVHSEDASALRQDMVERQIAARGVRDRRVLEAMREVPRDRFVEPALAGRSYDDVPLSIGSGQTISQPYIVAVMCESLGLVGSERVLEIGTGSGYGAAVLGRLAREVYTIERHPELAERAAARLAGLGFINVHVAVGDGTLGLPERAPYEAIVVTAAGPKVPAALLDQLEIGGRLVIPVGDETERQRLLRIDRRSQTHFHSTDLGGVAFVPLVGAEGWQRDRQDDPRERAEQGEDAEQRRRTGEPGHRDPRSGLRHGR
jgi:protein-L-isoaspartate(D-aspartate) O-methyltransferase